MSPLLVGVGVGPGDPDLVTVGALRALREADELVVPVADTGEEGRAERTVRAHLDRPVRRVVFALGRPADRAALWSAAAAELAGLFAGGAATVAFATIGDPNVYSTFGYLSTALAAQLRGLTVRTTPGITAMQALAAAAGTPLATGAQTLALLPLTAGTGKLRRALAEHDTVVAYKGGAALPDVLAAVREAGRIEEAVFGSALGLPGQLVRSAADLPPDAAAPYLSTLLVRRGAR